MSTQRATLAVTEELVRAYSRRGNFHSDADTATALGMPGLVAQGVQVAGPAYNILLDVWGDDFLEHGELDVRFVGMVLAGETMTRVDFGDNGEAAIEVTNTTAGGRPSSDQPAVTRWAPARRGGSEGVAGRADRSTSSSCRPATGASANPCGVASQLDERLQDVGRFRALRDDVEPELVRSR